MPRPRLCHKARAVDYVLNMAAFRGEANDCLCLLLFMLVTIPRKFYIILYTGNSLPRPFLEMLFASNNQEGNSLLYRFGCLAERGERSCGAHLGHLILIVLWISFILVHQRIRVCFSKGEICFFLNYLNHFLFKK